MSKLPSHEKELMVLDLYSQNIKIKDILKELSISQSFLYRTLSKYGIKKRDSSVNKTRKYFYNLKKLNEDSIEKYYWLGFIAADGYINLKNGSIRLELKSSDKKHLEKLIDFLGEKNLKIQKPKGKNSSYLDINSRTIVSFLEKEYGLRNAKSLNLKFPSSIPKEFISHFIRGYFDGDGWISKRRIGKTNSVQYNIGLCSGSEEFIKSLMEKVPFLKNKKYHFSSGVFRVTIGGRQLPYDFADYLYKNSSESTRLERKYLEYKTWTRELAPISAKI